MKKLKLSSGIFGQIDKSWVIKYDSFTSNDVYKLLSNKKFQNTAGKLIMENYVR